MNTIEIRISVGLSEKEAIAYLDLQQRGESQTGRICERTKIPSSHIYTILDSLLEKGLVSYKLVNNIKVFSASGPDALINLFEEREKKVRNEKANLLNLISQLKTIPPETQKLNDFKYFHGIRGIKSLFTEVINSWKEGDEYYIASAPLEAFRKLEPFFINVVHKKRVRDKVKLKMIINKNSVKWGLRRTKLPFTEIRYLDIDTKTEYGVLNDYFFLITYHTEPYGLLIKDENFASTYRTFFNILWERAKK